MVWGLDVSNVSILISQFCVGIIIIKKECPCLREIYSVAMDKGPAVYSQMAQEKKFPYCTCNSCKFKIVLE